MKGNKDCPYCGGVGFALVVHKGMISSNMYFNTKCLFSCKPGAWSAIADTEETEYDRKLQELRRQREQDIKGNPIPQPAQSPLAVVTSEDHVKTEFDLDNCDM